MSESKKVIIALGYFDSVHIGHQSVINAVKELAGNKYLPAVFTFKGNLKRSLGDKNGKCVFNYLERREILKGFGINEIVFAPVSKTFLKKGKLAFLNYINGLFDIKGYVFGKDYRFGKNGEGDAEFIKEYAKKRNQTVKIADTFEFNGDKVSTSKIKEYLTNGDLIFANKLLGFDYFLSGKVVKDRCIGTKLGFPTVNIYTDTDRFLIREGVYSGYTFIDGKRYKAVINYGARPTFDLDGKLIEGHIIGYNGNLYGKSLKLYFLRYIRDIEKFDNISDLIFQIKKDIESVKND